MCLPAVVAWTAAGGSTLVAMGQRAAAEPSRTYGALSSISQPCFCNHSQFTARSGWDGEFPICCAFTCFRKTPGMGIYIHLCALFRQIVACKSSSSHSWLQFIPALLGAGDLEMQQKQWGAGVNHLGAASTASAAKEKQMPGFGDCSGVRGSAQSRAALSSQLLSPFFQLDASLSGLPGYHHSTVKATR